jgi:aspartyl/asparaginyl beta-hydroxylase (cupin superfamily)
VISAIETSGEVTAKPDALSQVARTVKLELAMRDAARARHGFRSLLQHLSGTFDILNGWGQKPAICLAGLMHSAYSTDAFSRRTFSLGERDAVRELIGHEAERLVFLFATVRREELFKAAAEHSEGDVVVTTRITNERLPIAHQDVADLLPVYVANLAEQGIRTDGGPIPWLLPAWRIGNLANTFPSEIPTVFKTGIFASADSEADFVARYVAATCGDVDILSADMASLADSGPCLAEPLIWLGLMTLAAGDGAGASLLGRFAAQATSSFPLPWDRRLPRHRWMDLIVLLEGAVRLSGHEVRRLSAGIGGALERFEKPSDVYERIAATGCMIPSETSPSSGNTGFVEKDQSHDRFGKYVAAFRDTSRSPRLQLYPDISADAFYDRALFPLAIALEQKAAGICREYEALERHEFHSESENIARDGNWDVLMLHERGKRNEPICIACPQTMEALASDGCMRTLSGLAYFSRLAPGTKIAEHRGPTNMRLRCHLAIKVPPKSGLRVGGIEKTWEVGKCLVFNDALPHEAWNLGDDERVVLVVDLWHPDLTGMEVELLEGLQRYAFAHARNLEGYWEKNDRARQHPGPN